MSAQASDCERLFFEVLERTLRFLSHVENSCAQAARPNRRKTAQESIARTLTTRLKQNLDSLIKVYKSTSVSEQARMQLLRDGLQDLASLHCGPLSAVPRPYEPIELVSYIRQALSSDQQSALSLPPHVFATELLGDQAHVRFDQADFNPFKFNVDLTMRVKESSLGELAEEYLSNNFATEESVNNTFPMIDDVDGKAIGFVSLPRIDLGNPLRWPSLMHETGHFEAVKVPVSIREEFSNMENGRISTQAVECMKQYLNSLGLDPLESEHEVGKWLMECWCDAHATWVAGAPALFSQMHAFLFSTPCYLTEPARGKGYPPAWFRLRLMRALISTRHMSDNPSNKLINEMINEEWLVLERLFPPSDDADISQNGILRNLFQYFRSFLTQQFPQDKWLAQAEINPHDLEELIEDLSSGLPIPTHKRFVGVHQTRATHAEILLAGWAYRNCAFKKSLVRLVNQPDFSTDSSISQLLAIVDRADAALQMSIQVSEWFGILTKPSDEKEGLNKNSQIVDSSDRAPGGGLLADREIVDLLLNNSLRVIPLIGGVDQIEGTVVDIRLGHNFEIFFTNISGAMDAINPRRRDTVDSMEVDYDSLEGLEIAPGQFVLGHTLEYLKLPRDIAAEVNGRSSFARLGVEIHMTAPFIEAGFDGCLTLEIANSGHSTVKLYPGMRIAQLRFYRCSTEPKRPYGDRSEVKYRGRLRHNKTEQFTDWEIAAFEKEKERRGSS